MAHHAVAPSCRCLSRLAAGRSSPPAGNHRLYSRIKPDLAAPPKLCFASGNGHRTTACQLRDLANEMANRTGSGGNHNRLSGPWAAYIKYRNKLKFYPGNALLV